jgi:hypothetical protein
MTPAPKHATTCSPMRRAPGAIPGTLSCAGGFLRDGCNGSSAGELRSNDDNQWGGEEGADDGRDGIDV